MSWYIIPFEVLGRTNFSIHFTPGSAREKYGEYQEAWHLLKETGLTIQACVDPEWEGEAEEVAPADTRISRFARNDKAFVDGESSRSGESLGNDKLLRITSFLGIRKLFGGAGRNRTDA
jgi:hypothetical protein